MSTYPNEPAEQRSGWKILILGLVLLLALGAFFAFGGREEKLAKMSAADAHIGLGPGAAEPVTEIERGQTPEIYYHVVLRAVPLGWSLKLSCEWMDPGGSVARHNVYETRLIYKSTWPTHCRQQFGPAAAAGEWRVRLSMGDRVLSASSFILK